LTSDEFNNTYVTDFIHSIRIYVKDPVDGAFILGDNQREMLFGWCSNNCKGKYWIGMGFGQFELTEDALLFKLTWSQ
jgi:uncharacterized membrane protein